MTKSDRAATPIALKLILGYLSLVAASNVVALLLGGFDVFDTGACVLSCAVLLGMLLRVKVAYYLLYVVVTVVLYGVAVYILIGVLNTRGQMLLQGRFLAGLVLTVVPSVVMYKLLGNAEVRAQYVGTESTGPR